MLLDAFQSTASDHDGKLLILAGANSERIVPEIRKRGLQERVLVEDDVYEVDDYYAAADFTVYSSEYESFCLGNRLKIMIIVLLFRSFCRFDRFG